MDLEIGSTIFSKFLVLEKLGAGGMGSIYKARDTTLDRVVVIKVLSSQFNPQKSLVRFQNEARALGRLKHSNIADVYDFGMSDDGLAFLAMDFVAGINLREFVKARVEMPLSAKLEVFIKLCEAVKHAHAEGVIHRDIKPENIMMVPAGHGRYNPILLDFGVAKLFSEDDREQYVTTLGTVIGSPLFMSPEQADGKSITAATDQYSLGCVLYYFLTGLPPFEGQSALETLSMHRSDVPRSLSVVTGHEWTVELEELVARLLSKRADVRYENMQALIDEVRPIYEQSLDGETVGQVEEDQPDTHVSTDKRLSKLTLINLALVAVCVTGVIAFTLFSREPEEASVKQVTDDYDSAFKMDELTKEVGKNPTEIGLYMGYDDSQLAILSKCTRLRKVVLCVHGLSDQSTKYLLNSPVHHLNLTGTSVKTLEYVGKMKTVEVLELESTNITDDGIRNIAALPMLSRLDLDKTDVTDACLKSIEKMGSLVSLQIRETKISEKGADELAQKMPWLELGQLRQSKTAELLKRAKVNNISATESNALLQQAVDAIRKAAGNDAPMLSSVYLLQAINYIKLGKSADANRVVLQAVRIADKCGNVRDQMFAWSALANLRESEQNFEEGFTARKNCLEYAIACVGVDADFTDQVMQRFWQDCEKLKRFEERAAEFRSILPRMEKATCGTGGRYAATLLRTAQSEFAAGEEDRCKKHLEQLLVLLKHLPRDTIGYHDMKSSASFLMSVCFQRQHNLPISLQYAKLAAKQVRKADNAQLATPLYDKHVKDLESLLEKHSKEHRQPTAVD